MIGRRKEEDREKEWREVRYSKGMNEFWKVINRFRLRRKKKGGNIEKKEWDNHFRNLLEAKRGEEGGKEEHRGKIVESQGGEEELDREMTTGEVRRGLSRMKNNKAAGEDGIATEFLKHLPARWMEELARILNEVFASRELPKGWESKDFSDS